MKNKGFAPLIIILVIAILGAFAYFAYKNTPKIPMSTLNPASPSSSPTTKPIFVPTKAKITKINNEWGLYEDSNYNFSFEFPWTDGVRLDETNTRIEYPYPLTGTTGYSPDITVAYIANSQNLAFDKIIAENFNSDPWYRGNNIHYTTVPEGYEVYDPGNGLKVYINRTAPGADTNQSAFVLGPHGKFVLAITCFLKTPDVNHILSTLKFAQ